MPSNVETAIVLAAEAAMAHMVMMNRMTGAKVLSEAALYETINSTIRARTSCWVNHEHRVSLNGRSAESKPKPGDVARVDFGIGKGKEKSRNSLVTLLEVKLASRTKLRRSLPITRDIRKLYGAQPYESQETIHDHAYLIVINLCNDATVAGQEGWILWHEPPTEEQVHCIETISYAPRDQKGLAYTASVFRVLRKSSASMKNDI